MVPDDLYYIGRCISWFTWLPKFEPHYYAVDFFILKYGEQMISHPSFNTVRVNLSPHFFVCLQNVWFIFLHMKCWATGKNEFMTHQLIRLLSPVTINVAVSLIFMVLIKKGNLYKGVS